MYVLRLVCNFEFKILKFICPQGDRPKGEKLIFVIWDFICAMAIITLEEDIMHLRASGRILAKTLASLEERVQPGVSAEELDELADELIQSEGAIASFKNYGDKGNEYPAAICVSVNDEIVHALPSKEKVFKEGDIVGIDCGVSYHGLFTDAAVTLAVGEISPEKQTLLDVTKKSMYAGIKQAKPGNTISDISKAIQASINEEKYGIIRDLVGHGVGYGVHEDPRIPNFWPFRGNGGSGLTIVEGMVLAIEPMVTLGDWKIVTGKDGWSVHTADGSASAHFEHTILVRKSGAEIVTQG